MFRFTFCVAVMSLLIVSFAGDFTRTIVGAEPTDSPTTIALYEGVAPGSEDWTYQEKQYFSPVLRTQVVANVTTPTLTVYRPDKPNGTAIIICPGGAFHMLSIADEGTKVADWLVEKGFTAFLLKYRLVKTGLDAPTEVLMKMRNEDEFRQDVEQVMPLSFEDGRTALKHVRDHADSYSIDPNKIGLLGFSAGGTVACELARSYADGLRPNFIAPVYPYVRDIDNYQVPSDAPPLFGVAASDDELGLAPHTVQLYTLWVEAKRPAEMHLYASGRHGFGMRKLGLPSDGWIDRFGEWLESIGMADNSNAPAEPESVER